MIKQRNIYLAILNQGEIRTELSKVINVMIQEDAYRIHLSYPTAKPIANNRNTIVQKFLATDCDYLMMIDSDIVPPPNIMKLVDFDKDIITPLMFVYQKGELLPLFLKRHPDGIYDTDDYLEKTGLTEVAATGTGCMVIKREVLEKVKYPFRNEYDVDGIKTLGLDFNFCCRAKKLGYKIWVHLDYVASHHMTYDLKELFYIFINKHNTEKELAMFKDYLKTKPNLLKGILKKVEEENNKKKEEKCK